MKVLCVSEDCLGYFANAPLKKQGEIHAVFDRAVNIRFYDGTLVTLVAAAMDIAPMTLQVSATSFRSYDWIQGTKVIAETEGLLIDIQRLDFNSAKVWILKPDLGEPLPQDQIILRLERFTGLLLEKGNPDGLLPYLCRTSCMKAPRLCALKSMTNSYVTFIESRLDQFVAAYFDSTDRGEAKTVEAFSRIVGFGPGLTPATDDFVAGVMAACLWVPFGCFMDRDALVRRNQKLAQIARDKTTYVSESMLEHAASGRIASKYADLLKRLCYEGLEDLESVTLIAMNHGDTSGTDFLTGAAVAMNLTLIEKSTEFQGRV